MSGVVPEGRRAMDGFTKRYDELRASTWRVSGGAWGGIRGVVLLFLLAQPWPSHGQDAEERLFWESVECESALQVQVYLETYPDGAYVTEARACLEQRRAAQETVFWESVVCDRKAEVRAYLEVYPNGAYVTEARACLEQGLGLDRAARILVQQGLTSSGYTSGLADGQFGPATRAALQAWQTAMGFEATGYLDQAQADALTALGREAVVRSSFTIETDPTNARVRIMDIPDRYQAGMELAPGEYEVEVSAAGYDTVVETILHGSVPTVRRIELISAISRQQEALRLWKAEGGRQQTVATPTPFRDCPSCPLMVEVPAGWFLMGSPASEEGRDGDEGPQHQVTIAGRLAVGVYEVTFEEWDACVSGGGCNGYRPYDREWGRGRRPVIHVSWEDAQAYVRWLSEQTEESYRLLSEAEWEYVARAGTTTPFHFGRAIATSQANYNGNYTYGSGRRGRYRGQTVPVGSFAPNAFGLYDMHGNVWEWVEDCWSGSYRGAPADGSARDSGDCSRCVRRGGSWIDLPPVLRSAFRNGFTSVIRVDVNGFRVARTIS